MADGASPPPPPPAAPPYPHGAMSPAPFPAAPPRPGPGSFDRALTDFWRAGRRPLSPTTLGGIAVIGVLAAGVLVGHRLGLGAALIALLLWVPAVPAMVRRRALGDLVTAALSVALVAVLAVRDAGWVAALCAGAAVAAGAVAATSARTAPGILLSAVSWVAGVVRAMPWLGRGAGTLLGTRRGQVLLAVRSVAITAGLLVVFGLLFAGADLVFASYLPRIDLDLLPAQVAVGALVALVAATLVHLAVAPPGWSHLRSPAGRAARLGEWLLPIAALDVMVVGFVLVQLGALLGGHQHVLETAGLTYAEYAREGFGQLLAATALTLLVVAVAARRAPRATPRDRRITSVALAVLCLGTLGVVAAALRRMDLYVDAFGLTRLRLSAVLAELILAAILLLVLVAGARWRGGWLPRAVVQVVAVAMLALAAANPDAQIVRHNSTAGARAALDTSYLQGLSADAVPAIASLDEPLRSCLLARAHVVTPNSVWEWNLGRDRAAQTLTRAGEGGSASLAGASEAPCLGGGAVSARTG